MFHELLKAYHVEVRNVVRQALDLITPALSIRINNGNKLLCQCTKKIIVEEAHLMQQLFHVLHLVVRHYNVIYLYICFINSYIFYFKIKNFFWKIMLFKKHLNNYLL